MKKLAEALVPLALGAILGAGATAVVITATDDTPPPVETFCAGMSHGYAYLYLSALGAQLDDEQLADLTADCVENKPMFQDWWPWAVDLADG